MADAGVAKLKNLLAGYRRGRTAASSKAVPVSLELTLNKSRKQDFRSVALWVPPVSLLSKSERQCKFESWGNMEPKDGGDAGVVVLQTCQLIAFEVETLQF